MTFRSHRRRAEIGGLHRGSRQTSARLPEQGSSNGSAAPGLTLALNRADVRLLIAFNGAYAICKIRAVRFAYAECPAPPFSSSIHAMTRRVRFGTRFSSLHQVSSLHSDRNAGGVVDRTEWPRSHESDGQKQPLLVLGAPEPSTLRLQLRLVTSGKRCGVNVRCMRTADLSRQVCDERGILRRNCARGFRLRHSNPCESSRKSAPPTERTSDATAPSCAAAFCAVPAIDDSLAICFERISCCCLAFVEGHVKQNNLAGVLDPGPTSVNASKLLTTTEVSGDSACPGGGVIAERCQNDLVVIPSDWPGKATSSAVLDATHPMRHWTSSSLTSSPGARSSAAT